MKKEKKLKLDRVIKSNNLIEIIEPTIGFNLDEKSSSRFFQAFSLKKKDKAIEKSDKLVKEKKTEPPRGNQVYPSSFSFKLEFWELFVLLFKN